ncbi:HAMP domain-containing sensor histidine kinase [Actinoplanes sp. CA-142083]|uniref:HAMP domain-containing sensor histidine kinase n=1 Tax=Actinoplanes sp. CA-142083 TaxID=3239903 RepID=UPI003D8B3F2F
MRRPRLTVRARLTLLYSGLFAACGVILVAFTYGLLAANFPQADPKTTVPAGFADSCTRASGDPEADPALIQKCKAAYEQGLETGATTQREATLDKLLRYSAGTLFAVTLLATAMGWIVAGRVLRPVHQITEAARNASGKRLTDRLAMTGPRDELRELADTFDDMLDRLEAAFESQRRFIANAGHELRTPLAVMRASVDVVLAKPAPTPEELIGMGRDVRAAVAHAQALIDALLTLARTDRGHVDREEVDLATVTEDAIDIIGDSRASPRVHAALAPAPTSGDPILLERLAANLVDNALRYNVPDGAVWVSTGLQAERVVLTVANTGPVVASEAVGRLFEPFRRLHDRTGDGGFGLGLAIVASIATAHGGTAIAGARPDGGLTVTVSLPAAQ